MAKIDDILLAARKPGKGGYVIKNPRSGCIGIAAKKTAGSLPDLTVGHSADCGCLDVRLVALCRHADRMVKLGRLRRARKFDLVLALKLRSPALPEELRLRVRKQRRKAGVDDGGDEEVLRVVEYRNAQRLTETWKNLEAYRKRRVWLDCTRATPATVHMPRVREIAIVDGLTVAEMLVIIIESEARVVTPGGMLRIQGFSAGTGSCDDRAHGPCRALHNSSYIVDVPHTVESSKDCYQAPAWQLKSLRRLQGATFGPAGSTHG
ncbi:hypothetical protein DL769_001476 [Monosporascus sp. CRB-8-3]|nr:hypothetical protein DL769_001476 [Monosporascus sp. CRB-8-3]